MTEDVERSNIGVEPRHVAVDVNEYVAGMASLRQAAAVLELRRSAQANGAIAGARSDDLFDLLHDLIHTAHSCFELPARR